MENSKIDEIIDIRQSPEWGKYLEWLGWQKTSIGIHKNLYSLKLGLLEIAKMQRPDNLNQDDLQKLDDLAKSNKWAFIKLEPSLNQRVDDLTRRNFTISASPLSPPSTIFIDLSSPAELLWSKLSQSVRYSINRAKREGGVVEFITNPSARIISTIHPIIDETAKRQKFLAPNPDDVLKKLNLWQDHFHVAIVKNSDDVICGLKIFLGFNGNVWYMHGGTSAAGRKTTLGYLLLWEAILCLKKQSYKFLDLEGKDDKRFPFLSRNWGGFSHFKERFCGTNVEFPCPYIKYYNKGLIILNKIIGGGIPL